MDRVIAGRYQIGPLLGTGGMSAVYAANDRRLDRTVAIKLVPIAGTEPAARARFVREARSAAAFTHPNAVAVFDVGEADGFLYLVMERVTGRSLSTVLAEDGPRPETDATSIATSVLAALATAHAAGIVHRDVKPSNILIDDDGNVKLMDFGIAKRLDDLAGDVTTAGEMIGTPKYLAPEQVGGHPATAATDVYAVGVVLFEMLAGVAPFKADTPMATALAHRDAPVPDVRTIRPDVSGDLAETIRRAMAKRPEHRFASAAAMLAALAPTLRVPAGAAGATAPPEPTQIMRPGGYRRRSMPWWSLAALAVLAAGATALAVVVLNDRDDGTSSATTTTVSPSTTLAAAGTVEAATTTTTTTTVAATMAATTTTQATNPPSDPTTIDGLIATLQANPGAYGERTEDVIEELEDIRGDGRRAAEDAAKVLEKAAKWIDKGELDPVVMTLLEPVLDPLVARFDDDDDDDDDD